MSSNKKILSALIHGNLSIKDFSTLSDEDILIKITKPILNVYIDRGEYVLHNNVKLTSEEEEAYRKRDHSITHTPGYNYEDIHLKITIT